LGALPPADGWRELDLTAFPFRRAGGQLKFDWFDRQQPGSLAIPSWSMGYEGEFWAAVGDQGTPIPEDWFTHHRLHGRLAADSGIGAGVELEARASDTAGQGNALWGSAFGSFGKQVDRFTQLQLELGYSGGVALSEGPDTISLAETSVEASKLGTHG